VVKKNAGASLIDLGDGVGCIEFHSKMNALGGDIVQMVTQSLKTGGIGDQFEAFVISGDSANFSVGANLMMLMLAVQEEEWDEVDLAIKQFQGMTQAIKFCSRPVVTASFGMTLGGGCEINLHSAARQPHAELYMDWWKSELGLLPAVEAAKRCCCARWTTLALSGPMDAANQWKWWKDSSGFLKLSPWPRFQLQPMKLAGSASSPTAI